MTTAVSTSGPDRMGDRFVEAGVLTPAQAARSAQLAHAEGIRFGEAAVRLGYCTPAEVQKALSEQFHYPVASAGAAEISRSISIAHLPFSTEAEAIRQIRAEITIRLSSRVPMSIAVVSPGAGEGKSYLAASLAIAFAQAGNRTLLINANMRDSGQQNLFGAEGETGLSTMLAKRSLPGAGSAVADFPLLNVLGPGPKPPNPIEILYDGALRNLIGAINPAFDVYIVDTPAARDSADAQLIAQQIGSCLIVARKNVTRLSDVTGTQNMMQVAGVQVLGTVYNEFDGPTVLPRKAIKQQQSLLLGRSNNNAGT